MLLVGTSALEELSRAGAWPDGVVRCAPSQVVADLLTGPGRGTTEGEALIEWMRQGGDVEDEAMTPAPE